MKTLLHKIGFISDRNLYHTFIYDDTTTYYINTGLYNYYEIYKNENVIGIFFQNRNLKNLYVKNLIIY